MSSRTSFLLLVLIAVVAAGCASGQGDADAVSERVCVQVRDIHDFDALDERHVVVEARHQEYYLFTLDHKCSGITYAPAITIADRATRVCSDTSHWVSFSYTAGPKRCLISTIERVDDLDSARELVGSREEDWME